MYLLPIIKLKKYDLVCKQLCNIFTTELYFYEANFGFLDELYPGYKVKNSTQADNAIKFILCNIRMYTKQFHGFDTTAHPELISKLYNSIKELL